MAESRSWASRSPASNGQGGWGAKRQGEPVAYREGPFVYEPAVLCGRGMKAARLISWSDENPGRRYYRSDCGFYEWFDGEHCKFLRTLLRDLHDAVWDLKKENKELKNATGSIDGCNWREIEEIQQQIEVLQLQNVEMTGALKEKDRKIEEKDATATKFEKEFDVTHYLLLSRPYHALASNIYNQEPLSSVPIQLSIQKSLVNPISGLLFLVVIPK
ncbi:hypothetical protein BS78_10G089100 [Paspalum vaginatum]|nr:hypothetical protein BS78_10G089100 [Paspalum vaginatum]